MHVQEPGREEDGEGEESVNEIIAVLALSNPIDLYSLQNEEYL